MLRLDWSREHLERVRAQAAWRYKMFSYLAWEFDRFVSFVCYDEVVPFDENDYDGLVARLGGPLAS